MKEYKTPVAQEIAAMGSPQVRKALHGAIGMLGQRGVPVTLNQLVQEAGDQVEDAGEANQGSYSQHGGENWTVVQGQGPAMEQEDRRRVNHMSYDQRGDALVREYRDKRRREYDQTLNEAAVGANMGMAKKMMEKHPELAKDRYGNPYTPNKRQRVRMEELRGKQYYKDNKETAPDLSR